MITNWYDELVTPGARPPAFYVSMTPEFATGEYGFPAPSNGATFTAYECERRTPHKGVRCKSGDAEWGTE